jgi:ribonucleoside-diphosphate reductase alpha chain
MFGPRHPACEETHALKYRENGETFRQSVKRVARALADDSNHEHRLLDILLNQRFMPAGRVQAAMGAQRQTTPYNCFVSGTIHDSFVHGDDIEGQVSSIMGRATQAATTMRLGGGIGYDFSTLRPRKALIEKLHSHSSGPLSFMKIFNEICLCTSSAGHRRGAQMGVMRIDHPDILEFIQAKHNTDQFNGFNLSVGVTDEFMDCLARKSVFQLRFGGRVHGEIDAERLWEELMESTWDWAEPGVLFIDRINQMNNLWYCETIAATNPCGEQPLPPHGACLLGSFNLPKYLEARQGGHTFDLAQFMADIPDVVRAMDNVVDRAIYPLPEQALEARSKRRMGLGVTGLANALEAVLGGPSYGSESFLALQENILSNLAWRAYQASAQLAQEKGSFPLYDERYLAGRFIKTLPPEIQGMIRKHGIRNSHLLSIAPTGTISFTADNVSSSIEPVFEHVTRRPINTPEGQIVVDVPDYGFHNFKIKGKTTDEVTVNEHVNVLTTAARLVDSAVSKTCNVPGNIPWSDFKGIYLRAFDGGAKGCTTFNKEGKRLALLTKAVNDEGQSCKIDPESGRRSCE